MSPRAGGFAFCVLTSALLLVLGCGSGSEPSEPSLVVRSISPNAIAPGLGAALTLVVYGSGFQDGAFAERDGQALETSFASAGRVYATMRSVDLAQPDTSTIRVRNPDGTLSNGLQFFVTPAANPFHYDSTSPRTEAEVNADTSIAIYLSDALDPSSLLDTSVVVKDESGAAATGTLTYDDAAHVIHWTGALGPAHRYTVTLSESLRTPEGGGLSGSLHWSFTTTLGVTVLLDTVGTWPVMLLGANGLPRVAYKSLEGFKLASCSAGCDTRATWSVFGVGQLAGPDFLSAVTDGSGAIHFGFQDPATEGAMYANQAGQAAAVEGNASYTSIGVAPSGRLHLLYYQNTDLHAATCAGGCTSAANWTTSVVDTAGNVGSFTSVGIDALGGVHVTYSENDAADLRYATCAAPCTTPVWISGPIDTVGTVSSGSSLVVDASGQVHATWLDAGAGALIYGTCAADCTTMGEWSTTVVDPAVGNSHTSLALGPNGLEVSYYDALGGRLRGASCAAGCVGPGAWTTFTVSLSATGSDRTSLKVDSQGRRNVAWTDGHGGVRFTRY